MPASIFVSYSHEDIGLVQPVVRLLRATEDLVFQDLDSIKPGRKWRREIEEALYTAQLVILFWCYHSSRSAEVRREYEFALTTGKDVLPVLLDTTPLPEPLNEFQWVDFRLLVGSTHRSYRPSWRWVIRVVVLAVVWLFFMIWWVVLLGESRPRPEWYQPFANILFVVTVVTVGVFVTWIVWKAHRRWAARAAPTDYQQQMAEKLQGELFRRGLGST